MSFEKELAGVSWLFESCLTNMLLQMRYKNIHDGDQRMQISAGYGGDSFTMFEHNLRIDQT